MNTICIANVSRFQKPAFQCLIISMGPESVRPTPMTYAMNVKTIANRKGFGSQDCTFPAMLCPTLSTKPDLDSSVFSIWAHLSCCLLYTSDAADDLTRVDLVGLRIIKK